jgi:hypothetical protein
MLRFLFVRHPYALCVVLFMAAMLLWGRVIVPAIVEGWGLAGTVTTVGICLAIGFWIDRRG